MPRVKNLHQGEGSVRCMSKVYCYTLEVVRCVSSNWRKIVPFWPQREVIMSHYTGGVLKGLHHEGSLHLYVHYTAAHLQCL